MHCTNNCNILWILYIFGCYVFILWILYDINSVFDGFDGASEWIGWWFLCVWLSQRCTTPPHKTTTPWNHTIPLWFDTVEIFYKKIYLIFHNILIWSTWFFCSRLAKQCSFTYDTFLLNFFYSGGLTWALILVQLHVVRKLIEYPPTHKRFLIQKMHQFFLPTKKTFSVRWNIIQSYFSHPYPRYLLCYRFCFGCVILAKKSRLHSIT